MNKILFYYGIIVSTILLIGSFFFVPRLQNFVIAASLIPIVAYFWLTATNPNKSNFSQWSVRFLISVTVLSLLGIFAFSQVKPFSAKNNDATGSVQNIDELKSAIDSLKNSSDSTSNAALLSALNNISQELIDIRAEQRGMREILGITSSANEVSQIIASLGSDTASKSAINTPDIAGFVTPTSSTIAVYAYSQASKTSNQITKLTYNQKYPYFKKSGNWYQILLPDDREGWVSSNEVKETN